MACLAIVLGGNLEPVRAWQGDGYINREHQLKALFLYNFGHYVEWPAQAFVDAQQPFVIGLLGSSPVESTLREIAATRQIAGRGIVVKRFDSHADVTACQILFVSRAITVEHFDALIEDLRGLPVLIVGEREGFASRGGCVNFFIESNKIRFEINREEAKQHNLRMSAKLLALARIVQ